MQRIALSLRGKVARLIALTLEGGAKDITEWFEQGHSEVELISQLEEDGVTQ